MGCLTTLFWKLLTWIAEIAKIACAAAIIAIVAVKLTNISTNSLNVNGTNVSFNNSATMECVLGTDLKDHSLCTVAFAVSGISIALSFAVAILLCCTCNLCGLGPVLELAFAFVGTLMWLATSIVMTKNVQGTSYSLSSFSVSMPQENWRTTVVALTWTEFGLFLFIFFVYMVKILSAACGCFTCCCDDEDEEKGNKVHAGY
ncbi:hypothetical protein CEUSTIGMA_g3567.t1 [Chlamydomonas eustigma]|uniref:MARVEL domain-containing protein n=1 Tax=Chlamydomonas eustigma TaxID=1157962 RepID=A0A250WZ52_9CHLO|nr:hypothetical protein CEUSTIGMA_g3567.t1 [Chlamydomonas eustigma]|eukprot:GAX76124.1 hypothetical protein CEUSTIGMA_g3567.t1 [Chlamydomonas eustigma]